jgi:SAM-dependent methyltransferase
MEVITRTECPCCGSPRISFFLSAKDFTVSGEHFEIWVCKECTAGFTQHVPTQTEIGRYYKSENYISHTDTKKGLVNSLYHVVRKRTLRQKSDLIKRTTGLQKGKILDIGAGTGAFTDAMKRAGWEAEGLEPDQDTRNRAMELYNIRLKDTAELYSITGERFDAVTMWHVLEHVHDLHEYLERIFAVLKPGGKAFIAVPNYTSHDAVEYLEYWAAYDVPRHLYHFSPEAMNKLLRKHGFSNLFMVPMWFDSFYVSMLSEQYKTGSPGYLNAFITGLKSNFLTTRMRERCSSLIYIASKPD